MRVQSRVNLRVYCTLGHWIDVKHGFGKIRFAPIAVTMEPPTTLQHDVGGLGRRPSVPTCRGSLVRKARQDEHTPQPLADIVEMYTPIVVDRDLLP